MWRKALIQVGEFFESKFFMNASLTVFGASGGVTIIVNTFTRVTDSSKSNFAVALDAFISTLWLFLFFLLTYLIFKSLSNFLIWAGNYYPHFYYFPKITISANITHENEIELAVANNKQQRITIMAVYAMLQSNVESLPDQATGISPNSRRQLFSLSEMTGRDKRVKKIGKIDNGIVILSAGDSNGAMRLEMPGTYQYWINLYGEFKGRDYNGTDKITFRITEKSGVIIDD